MTESEALNINDDPFRDSKDEFIRGMMDIRPSLRTLADLQDLLHKLGINIEQEQVLLALAEVAEERDARLEKLDEEIAEVLESEFDTKKPSG